MRGEGEGGRVRGEGGGEGEGGRVRGGSKNYQTPRYRRRAM